DVVVRAVLVLVLTPPVRVAPVQRRAGVVGAGYVAAVVRAAGAPLPRRLGRAGRAGRAQLRRVVARAVDGGLAHEAHGRVLDAEAPGEHGHADLVVGPVRAGDHVEEPDGRLARPGEVLLAPAVRDVHHEDHVQRAGGRHRLGA